MRLGLLVILITLSVLVSGCTSAEPEKIGEVGQTATTYSPTTTVYVATTTTPTTTTTLATFKIGDIVSNKNIALTVNSEKYEDYFIYNNQFGSMTIQPKADNRFLVIDLTIQNVGSDSKYFSPVSLTVADNDGFSYNIDSNWMYLDNKLDVASNIPPGKKVRGEVLFQIPINSSAKEIVYDDLINKIIVIQLQ